MVTTSPAPLHRELLASPESVPVARRALALELRSWGLDHLVDDAELVVSELVSNAVRVSPVGSPVVLDTEYDPAYGVKIAVWDRGGGRPEQQAIDPTSECGRGMLLVHADEVWLVPESAGKWVCALLKARR